MKQPMSKKQPRKRTGKPETALANVTYDLLDMMLKYLQQPDAAPEAYRRAVELFSQIKNAETRQALMPATPAMRKASCGYQLKQLHDSTLQGVDLYPGDVIALESLTPPEQGELVVGIKKGSGNYLAGYYYTLEPGQVLVLGAAERFQCWQLKTGEVEILGRVVGFDSFYDVEDLGSER